MKLQVLYGDKQHSFDVEEGNLFDVLMKHGIFLPSDCGGNGKCGKCKVKVKDGTRFEGVTPDADGCVLSCEAKIVADSSIEVFDAIFAEKSFYDAQTTFEVPVCNGNCSACNIECSAFNAALDLGTTTLVASLVDERGNQIASTSSLNPQIVYGADVLSRIEACSNGQLEKMCALVKAKINQMLAQLKDDAHVKNARIKTLCVAGNATMLHVFACTSPVSMGQEPFEPEFVDVQHFDGANVGINADKIVLLPSSSAFIGADVVAGALAVNLNKKGENNLLVDLGTNGEIVLSLDGEMDATSTAAGPALEGATLQCGMGGIDGAITSFRIVNGERVYTVLGSKVARGICGAGVVDVVAELLKHGTIDSHGTFSPNSDLHRYIKDKCFFVTDNVYLSIKDIREFQLAKSAIRTGIDILLSRACVSASSIDNVYIAGGLGQNVNVQNATIVGMFPYAFKGKFVPVGDSALEGAVLASGNSDAVKKMSSLSTEIEAFSLASDFNFGKEFIKNIEFEQ